MSVTPTSSLLGYVTLLSQEAIPELVDVYQSNGLAPPPRSLPADIGLSESGKHNGVYNADDLARKSEIYQPEATISAFARDLTTSLSGKDCDERYYRFEFGFSVPVAE